MLRLTTMLRLCNFSAGHSVVRLTNRSRQSSFQLFADSFTRCSSQEMSINSINAHTKGDRAISFISKVSEFDGEGDLPTETSPLLDSGTRLIDPSITPKRKTKRSNTIAGSFIASVTHTISTSVRQLRKSVGFLQGFALTVGILIGSGVFISPSLVMVETQDAGIALLLWLGCGLIALGGSLCYCELGCAIKRAGGNYAYIHEAYGNLPAFLCCWTIAFIVDPAGVAAITLTFGIYIMKPFESLIEPNPWYPKAIAAACIILIAIINGWSVTAATRAQTLFTFAQITAVLFVVVIGCWKLGEGHTENLKGMFNTTHFRWSNAGALGAALYNGLWAYDGWALIANVTEEMTNLEKNLFLSIVTGIPFVIICYLLVNISFLSALTVQQIGESPAVAVLFIQETLGKKVAYLMPIFVALSCYGAANGTVFACGRLSLAAGRGGHLPQIMSMIHKTRHTPIPAIIMTTIISLMMLIPDSSSLETLIGFFNFSCWLIYGLSIFAVVVLRYRSPDMHRPYKVWIITPILMTLISAVLVVVPFLDNPVNPSIALGMVLLGIPVYYFLIYLEPKHPKCLSKTKEKLTRAIRRYLNLAPCSV